MPTTGWKIEEPHRRELLERFPPQWPDVIADHITLDADLDADAQLPSTTQAEIVGGIDDGKGLQAMVVAIAGTSDRPDGGTYHITWSLDRGQNRKASDSNVVIAELGWRPLANPIPISITPARLG